MSRLQIVGDKLLDQFALNIPGVDQYAFVDNPSFKTDTIGTFAMRIRFTTVLTGVAIRGILSYGVKDAGNNSQLTFVQRWNSDSGIAIPYRSNPFPDVIGRPTHNGTIARAYGNNVFTAGAWGLLGIQSNGSAWQWLWNGSSIGATAWLGAANTGLWLGGISGTNHRLALGAQFVSNAPAIFSDQRSNEVMYFNRLLTSGEWTWLHNGGVPRNPHGDPALMSACRMWLRCGDSRDNGTTLFDESGYGNDATLVNMNATNYVTP
jgi:hypothetical protein